MTPKNGYGFRSVSGTLPTKPNPSYPPGCPKTTSNQSALAEHSKLTRHTPKLKDVKLLRQEATFLHKIAREVICIKQKTSPILNRDGRNEICRLLVLVTSTAPSSFNSRNSASIR